MVKLFNRAGMTVSGTPGTGTITLGAAITAPKKYLSFSDSGVVDADKVRYLIEDGAEFEFGLGTYTVSGTTLSRDTVIKSSNAGAKISATSAALVYLDAGAEDFWHCVTKTNDTSRASTTTLTDDPDLKFNMLANTTYDIRVVIKLRSTAATDFKFGFTGPASPAEVYGAKVNEQIGVAAGSFEAYPTALTVIGALDGAATVLVEMTVENGANAGVFALAWAQNTSGAGPTLVKAGSYIEHRVR